jgi:hypothetical protein
MANYYTHFAVIIEKTTVAESEWLRDFFASDEDEDDGMTCHEGMEIVLAEGNRALISDSGGNGNVGKLAYCLREFLAAHRPADRFIFSWASTCDKARPDGFDGGAVIVRSRSTTLFNPMSMAKDWDESGGCKPDVYDYSTPLDELNDATGS